MANLKSGIILNPGENLVMELEAELWSASANPIAKFFGSIRKFIAFLFGNKAEGYLVITDKRVVEIIQYKALWVLNAGKNVRYLLPASVKEIGYTKEGTCFGCFCQSYNLYYEAFTQRTSILLADVTDESEAQKVVDSFYKAISSAQ